MGNAPVDGEARPNPYIPPEDRPPYTPGVPAEDRPRRCSTEDPKYHYEFGRTLGIAAHHLEVFEVTETSTHRQFACKKIRINSPHFNFERAFREMGHWMSTEHPYLTPVHDVFYHDRCMFIVMELFEQPGLGLEPDLFTWLIEAEPHGLGLRDASPQQVAAIVFKCAEAIKYVNDSNRSVHGHLKLENILLGASGIDGLKVSDYWSHTLVYGGELPSVDGEYWETKNDGYMPAEVLRSGDISKFGDIHCDFPVQNRGDEPFKIDVFSLGVVMFACCAKIPAFELGPRARHSILEGKYNQKGMAKIRPPAARNLCEKMLACSQEERYSIEQVLADPWILEYAFGLCAEHGMWDAAWDTANDTWDMPSELRPLYLPRILFHVKRLVCELQHRLSVEEQKELTKRLLHAFSVRELRRMTLNYFLSNKSKTLPKIAPALSAIIWMYSFGLC